MRSPDVHTATVLVWGLGRGGGGVQQRGVERENRVSFSLFFRVGKKKILNGRMALDHDDSPTTYTTTLLAIEASSTIKELSWVQALSTEM